MKLIADSGSTKTDWVLADGADEFIEVGPGTALQGMVKRVNPDANAHSAE